MASFNKVIIMGNLTRDPEVRTIPSGQSVCEITLAVNEKFKDKENVTFVDITVWGKQAETLARWKKKGEALLVEGRLQMDKWQDKESGQNRSKLKVTCVSFTFVGGGKAEGGQKEQQPQNMNWKKAEPQGGYDDYATSFPSDVEAPPF